ncbi:MAG: Maf family protein, partial [Gammaproteobacteria bacterium]
MRTDIHLASSSPRRHEILAAMGIRFTAAGVDIDETRYDGEPVTDMVVRLAVAKVGAARATVDRSVPVLGADTAVALDDHVLGKPESEGEAVEMLTSLSGRAHKVWTGVALDHAGEITSVTSVTEVRFREIRHDEASAYWQSGEPRDKAGAYAVQGIGGIFVEYISGSYSGVVGLPVFETAKLLSKAGLVVLPLDVDRLH